MWRWRLCMIRRYAFKGAQRFDRPALIQHSNTSKSWLSGGLAIGASACAVGASAYTAGWWGHASCEEQTVVELRIMGEPSVALEANLDGVRLAGDLTLRDGRKLAYHVEGSGVPVVVYHGMGSSRFTWVSKRPLSSICPGIRLIAVDRPGYGDSSPPPAGYSYTMAAADLAELVDDLGIKEFCVAGHSSGGPFALAAAALLPERVIACAAICSDPPYCHPDATLELRLSDSMSSAVTSGGHGCYGKEPAAAADEMRKGAMEKGPEVKRYAWKQGTLGWVYDFTLERIAWSFMVENIKLGSAITFWAGEKDFPPILLGAPFLQSLVPGSQMRIVPGGDHGFKSKPEHLADILTELRIHWDAAAAVRQK